MPAVPRREFLSRVASNAAWIGAAGVGAAGPLVTPGSSAAAGAAGRADSCIFLWLGGGACHIDTWDPKRKGDAQATKKVAGSYYDSIPTAIDGVRVCEHLSRMARLLDRCAILRTVNHEVIDEHAAAVNRLHTGRPPTGATVYPSVGSIVAHELGARGDGVPAYVLIGYPSASRGPGFLGARHGYVYLTDTDAGPAGLQRPPSVSRQRQERREKLLEPLRDRFRNENSRQPNIDDYTATSLEATRLAGPRFMSVFDLGTESKSLRSEFGGEFGQRCLLARRLVEAGVRFVEVSFNLNFINGTGWDTHNEGQRDQHLLIRELDQALAALITDLEHRKRLDRTLIVVATEFGRPAEFDAGGGRGHYSKAFSIVLAGGGLRTGQAIGVTDELGKQIVERPVSVPDLHATIHTALGIEPNKELFDSTRPVPITDHGTAIGELFG